MYSLGVQLGFVQLNSHCLIPIERRCGYSLVQGPSFRLRATTLQRKLRPNRIDGNAFKLPVDRHNTAGIVAVP